MTRLRRFFLVASITGILTYRAAACNYGTYGLTPGDDSQATVDGLFRGEYDQQKGWLVAQWRQAALESASASELPGQLGHAWALHMSGQRPQAAALYEKLLAANPGSYEVLCSYATALHANKNYERASALLKQAVALKPRFRNGAEELHLQMIDHEARSRSNYAYAQDNLFVPALTPLWKNRKDPENNFSTVDFPEGLTSEGMAELLRQYPLYGEAWLALGMLLEHEENFSMAAKAYDRALDKGTAHAPELKKYIAAFRDFAREHDAGRVVARGIKRLFIGLGVLAVLLFLYRIGARVIWDVTSHRAMKEDQKRRERRKQDDGPL